MTFFSVLNLIVFVTTIISLSVTEIISPPYDLRTLIWKLVIGLSMTWFVVVGMVTSVSELILTIMKVV